MLRRSNPQQCPGTEYSLGTHVAGTEDNYPSSRILLASDPDFGSLATDPTEYIIDLTTPEKTLRSASDSSLHANLRP